MTATLIQAGLTTPPPSSPETDLPMLAWRDDDKKKPTAEKVQDALDRFRQKFKADPTFVMTSAADAMELDGFDELDVQAKTYIQRFDFFVGRRDDRDSGRTRAYGFT